MKRLCNLLLLFILFSLLLNIVSAQTTETLLIEAEHFTDYGGWVHDSQFMDQMGSPFLLAHGLGTPVKDAVTELKIVPGIYRVWVRTRDWVAVWNAPGTPGKFQLLVNDKPLETFFGTENAEWHWQNGGTIEITGNSDETTKIALHDLTGFEGRCDAILFSSNMNFVPPNQPQPLAEMRRQLLGFPETPEFKGHFDLVVVGGGIAGICSAVSAARHGLTVALIQDRPVLGGNNSSEVRVWLQGARNIAPYKNIGNVVAELEQQKSAHYGPANTADLYEDERKIAIVNAEKNITLLLEHRVNNVIKDGNRIIGVIAQNTRTGRDYRFDSQLFADCTGDGCLGFLAGADYELTEDGHMGPCNLWNIVDIGTESPFPRCSWALDLSDKPFPGRQEKDLLKLGGWYWESGFYRNPIEKAEYIRDWNFRAAYGAWDALKNTDHAFPTSKLNWMAHIAGKRESRRLMGDVILSKEDLINAVQYEDAAVPTGWPIDLHLPEPKYQKGFEGDEFISVAHYTKFPGPYWIPYRCLYSRNIENLFMAGRDISVTHEGLGTSRVMRTGGCMGEIVGMAASLCKKYSTTPRSIYQVHLTELKSLMDKGVTPSPEFAPPKPKLLKPTAGNQADKAVVTVSSNAEHAKNLNDGNLDLNSNESRWISSKADRHEIVFEWNEPVTVNSVRIISGYTTAGSTIAPISDFRLQNKQNGKWIDLLRSDVAGNSKIDYQKQFPETVTQSLRLIITGTQDKIARIWEIEFYEH
ncbi:MAG: FAD-dependent oxidoreductase [Planctomycetaceae bacterium]|jgi:hypothetical protein|nr:FAD-dependent oxidoreductase [Planctomycetaceae bacterium]